MLFFYSISNKNTFDLGTTFDYVNKTLTFGFCSHTITHILKLDIANGGATIVITSSTASASLRVSLLYAWIRLCQNQATCAQLEALGRTNKHLTTKKS